MARNGLMYADYCELNTYLLKKRRGLTELAMVLAREAKVIPAMVVCEMPDGATGKALSKEDAKDYATAHGLAYAEGKEVEALFKYIKP